MVATQNAIPQVKMSRSLFFYNSLLWRPNSSQILISAKNVLATSFLFINRQTD